MDTDRPLCECCECVHFMPLCGMGSWCYKYHRKTDAGGTCEAAEKAIADDEAPARYIDGYAEQQSEICP